MQLLGNNQEIQNIGEMHHFFKYLDENKKYSLLMKNYMRVNFGRTKINYLSKDSYANNRKLSERIESHSSIIKHFFNSFSNNDYTKYQDLHISILDSIFF